MADGRAKPIADVQVGDAIVGTVVRGAYRRYVTTEVVAHWSTVKPGYRVFLEDGTMLVASGDHRFLTDRGWKHVTGSQQGEARRPHLTINNKLMGTGGFTPGPKGGAEYRRGYLCGMIRGDGHLGSYRYERPGQRDGDVYRFRLALVDDEGLDRTRTYLADHGVQTQRFAFSPATATHRAANAIRTSRTDDVAAIEDLIRWPTEKTSEWAKGFLAGIFDAEGSFRGSLRISNTDAVIIHTAASCLRKMGFLFRMERTANENGLVYVRLLGGLREAIRFFHTVDPAITRKRTFGGAAVKGDAPLRVESIEPLGFDLPMFDITTGTGDFIADGVVSHNCFARPTHTFLDMNAGSDFEKKIVVKVNAPDVLRRQLAAKRWKGEGIAMGTNTDPYQRAEGRYRLMPRIIQALTDYRNPFSILTKGTLILRDLDLLVEAARVTDVSTAFSIGTLDEDAWNLSEPGTPHPRKRIEAVRTLNEAGIPCGVLIAPVLPGITDDPGQLREVVTAALDAGAVHVSPILLHLRPGVREEFMPWLAEHYPDLVPRYEKLYARPYAPAAERDALGRRVAGLIARRGGIRGERSRGRFARGRRLEPPPDPPGKQLTLL